MTTENNTEIDRSVRMPGWVVAIIATLTTGAIAAAAAGYVEAHTEIALANARIERLEADEAKPATVAEMSVRLGDVERSLVEVNRKLDDLTARKPR